MINFRIICDDEAAIFDNVHNTHNVRSSASNNPIPDMPKSKNIKILFVK